LATNAKHGAVSSVRGIGGLGRSELSTKRNTSLLYIIIAAEEGSVAAMLMGMRKVVAQIYSAMGEQVHVALE
jgi:hypothetical protein